MSKLTIYPWQTGLWQRLSEMRRRLPHALLFRGRSGLGKFDFALELGKSLLCQLPAQDGHACNHCPSCGWFAQNNHPDYRLLTPEQDSSGDEDSAPPASTAKKTAKKTQISVAQVRELAGFLELSSHRSGGLRIALIHPAEALNPSAANALLKMLEEPPPGVIFLLVTHQPQRLLATIISRCQQIDMPIPPTEAALRWLHEQGITDAAQRLDYAGGSPLSVIAQEDSQMASSPLLQLLGQGTKLDPFVAAPMWNALGMEQAITALQKWIYDLLLCRLVGEIRYHGQFANALQALSKSVNLGALLDFQRGLDNARKSATHPLNNELQLESLLLGYTQLFSIQTKS